MKTAAENFKPHAYGFTALAFLFLSLYAAFLPPWLPFADENEYLAAARNLAVSGTYVLRAEGPDADASPGREPLYPFLLSGLFHIDPDLRAATQQEILNPPPGSESRYRHIRYLNAALLALAAVMTFAAAGVMVRSRVAAWAAGAYIVFNFQIAQDMTHAVSDYLAMALVAAAGLILCLMAPGRTAPHDGSYRSALLHLLLGIVLALLCLTKAAFAGFAVILCAAGFIAGMFKARRGRFRPLLLATAMTIVTVSFVGSWMLRNEYRYGDFAISDGRGAVVLSTREVFNDMTACEYFTSFVYWLRGPGDELAEKFIDPSCRHRFVDEAEDGFYMTGQFFRVLSRMDALQKSGLSPREARKTLPWQIVGEILARWPMYIATMLPVFWRGIWCDEFVIFGLPAMLWLAAGHIRRRDFTSLAVFALPFYSLAFYTAFSLNIPRYQFTAVPGFAVAAGWALAMMLDKIKVKDLAGKIRSGLRLKYIR